MNAIAWDGGICFIMYFGGIVKQPTAIATTAHKIDTLYIDVILTLFILVVFVIILYQCFVVCR